MSVLGLFHGLFIITKNSFMFYCSFCLFCGKGEIWQGIGQNLGFFIDNSLYEFC